MDMEKLIVEYELSTRTPSIIWGMISTDAGLQKWMADEVHENDGIMTFTWGDTWRQHDTRTAKIVTREKNSHIKMKWDYIDDDSAYLEMRIEKSEITGLLHLVITDYSEPDDTENLRNLWNDNLSRLHNVSGL